MRVNILPALRDLERFPLLDVCSILPRSVVICKEGLDVLHNPTGRCPTHPGIEDGAPFIAMSGRVAVEVCIAHKSGCGMSGSPHLSAEARRIRHERPRTHPGLLSSDRFPKTNLADN